jgi:hypothetical protein
VVEKVELILIKGKSDNEVMRFFKSKQLVLTLTFQQEILGWRKRSWIHVWSIKD